MPWTPPTLDDKTLNDLFPVRQADPVPKEFEVGLVLGGTVSSGAFTAGVLDYLIEALDSWDYQLERGEEMAPRHRLVIKAVGGASGGGVCGAILGRIAPYAFPHVKDRTADASTQNPLFDVWVNQLDIAQMLNCDDLKNNAVLVSLLNAKPIDQAAAALCRFVGKPLGEKGTGTPLERRWMNDTLSLFFTLTNLRGMPYKINFGDGPQSNPVLAMNFVNHSDYVRFELDTRPGVTIPLRPDAFGSSQWRNPAPPGFVDWNTIRDYAAATGAFPVGFKARNLARPLDHYAYRATVVPNSQQSEIRWLTPDWDVLKDINGNIDPVYQFTAVDGGATDNAPLELVRTALAGLAGRNERSGKLANRCVVLIDPFTSRSDLKPDSNIEVQNMLMRLGLGMVAQSRYHTADLLLAADQTVFSRFMITASRDNKVGSDALATSPFGAFLGFLCRPFREHDFLLGRHNAYEFLKHHFLLPAENRLFSTWTPAQKQAFASIENGVTYLPLVPLFGDAANPPPVPTFPVGALDPENLEEALEQRVDAVLEALGDSDISGFWARLGFRVIEPRLRGDLTDKIIAGIKSALKEGRLMH